MAAARVTMKRALVVTEDAKGSEGGGEERVRSLRDDGYGRIVINHSFKTSS
jgi:hypothetical protein